MSPARPAQRSAFIDFLAEQAAPLGRLSARRMFGAEGIYLDGVFLGLVVDDVLYLKSDEESRPRYLEAGCEIFSYETKTGRRELPFYAPPEGTVEEQEALLAWLRVALGAALRKQAGRKGGGRAPRSRR